MALRITQPKRLQAKSRTHQIEQINTNLWKVTSGGSGRFYAVKLQSEVIHGAITYTGGECTCKWGNHRPGRDRRSACSHVQALLSHLAGERDGRTTSAWGNTQDAKRQHRPVTHIGDGVTITSRKAERKTIFSRAKALVEANPWLNKETVVFENGTKVTIKPHQGRLWMTYKEIPPVPVASFNSLVGWELTLTKEQYDAWAAHCQA